MNNISSKRHEPQYEEALTVEEKMAEEWAIMRDDCKWWNGICRDRSSR
jgi:hypothetical protein